MNILPLIELIETDASLIIRGANGFKQEIIESRKNGKTSNEILADFLEYHICNSGWDYIQPEEIGALTDAIILGNDVVRDDQGKLVETGKIYWFESYAVVDPAKELYKKGELIFQKA